MKSSTYKVPNSEDEEAARICSRIRTLAAKKQMTNTQLAKEAGVSYRLVYEIMRGTANLRDRTVEKFARALGTTLEDILQLGADTNIPDLAVREPPVAYSVKEGDSSTVPLHAIISMLSRQTGITEEKILEFLMTEMKGKRG